MSDWISVEKRLPELFEIVWIYWRDNEVVLGCRCNDGQNSDNDPEWGWYSFSHEKSKWTHFWMPHILHPCEPPMPPNYVKRESDDSVRFVRYDGLEYYGARVLIDERGSEDHIRDVKKKDSND